MCDMVVVSPNDRTEGGINDKVFQTEQEQCFLWERGAHVGVDFGLFKA